MKELLIGGGIGASAYVAQAIQEAPAFTDPSTWSGAIEKGGVIGVLVLVITGLLLFLKYIWVRHDKEKEATLLQHRADLDRKDVQYRSELDKKDARITALENTVDRLEERLERYEEESAKFRELLGKTINQIDVTPTLKRSALELNDANV